MMCGSLKNDAGTAVTVGTFDGVHSGHRAVLGYLKEKADRHGLRPMAFTFDRHPLEVVAPLRAPKLIIDAEARDSLIKGCGVDVVRIEFTEEVRRKSAARWMRELKDRYGARLLLVGYDNTFGCDGMSMTTDDFMRMGEEIGLKVEVAPKVPGCSPSAVRRAVETGDMREAARILGRRFSLSGKVVHGREIGRTIGIPTANLSVASHRLLPRGGVYSAVVHTPDGAWKALVNVGSCPTVSGEGTISVEAHLLDFAGNLYGRNIEISFDERLRDEKKFNGIEELREQIMCDIEAVRAKNIAMVRRD